MKEMTHKHPASFRDPSGFVYERNEIIYRYVHRCYQAHYENLIASGLAAELIRDELLLPFAETDAHYFDDADRYKTLQTEKLPLISYPWEWSFAQYKDAALLTLDICKRSLSKGMILKDATPLNVQFYKGRPLWMDILSFENYIAGTPWVAYRQFCETFLYPLLIHAYTGMEVHHTMLAFPEGISAQHTAKILPWKAKFNLHLYLHVWVPAATSHRQSSIRQNDTESIKPRQLQYILDSLTILIRKLKPLQSTSAWKTYYDETILNRDYLEAKQKIIGTILRNLEYQTVVDLGANTGLFSQMCAPDAMVTAVDADATCIDALYQTLKKNRCTNIYPLVAEVSYPSPAIGFMNRERQALLTRLNADVCLALGLLHHLVIQKHLPVNYLASFFASICNTLIIEYVPVSDPKVQELLRNAKAKEYSLTYTSFINHFNEYFTLLSNEPVGNSGRIICVMQKIKA